MSQAMSRNEFGHYIGAPKTVGDLIEILAKVPQDQEIDWGMHVCDCYLEEKPVRLRLLADGRVLIS